MIVRRVIPSLAGFFLGAVLLGLATGRWHWDILGGALTGAAILLIVTALQARWSRRTRA